MIHIPKPPPMSGKSSTEQLETIRTYLTVVVEQLNWALGHIEDSLASVKGNTDKPSVVQSTPPKYIAQVAQVDGWDITFYRDNTCEMETTVSVIPESDSSNIINGIPTYISKPFYMDLPVMVSGGVVTGENATEHTQIIGLATVEGDSIRYFIKSRREYTGNEEHEVHLKVSGNIASLAEMLSALGGETNE